MKQRTILRETELSGQSLHTGENVKLTFKPAPVDHGVLFRRVDIYGKPEIRPHISQVSELVRSTTVASGHTKIRTIEHVLSALQGLGIDNIEVEMDGSEPPILDGSAKPFVDALLEAEPVEQEAERKYFTVKEPISVSNDSRSLIALPHDGLRITCTSSDDRGIHTQHLSLEIDPDTYVNQVASARTFTVYEEIEELLKMGKIQGGSLDSAIVLKGDKVLSKEPLRFKDELVRHKILDIIGDISLIGCPIKAHLIAVRPGHALNAEFAQAVHGRLNGNHSAAGEQAQSKAKPKPAVEKGNPASSFDITRILELLPHRYPFLLIDRVTETSETEITAIKNVTINEPFFTGHYPGNPVMPGVLQIETMAQAAGVMMLHQLDMGGKMAFFMSCDKVKFRKAVVPGDQLKVHAKLVRNRANKIAVVRCECRVEDKVVSEAELMFTFIDTDG